MWYFVITSNGLHKTQPHVYTPAKFYGWNNSINNVMDNIVIIIYYINQDKDPQTNYTTIHKYNKGYSATKLQIKLVDNYIKRWHKNTLHMKHFINLTSRVINKSHIIEIMKEPNKYYLHMSNTSINGFVLVSTGTPII